MIKLKIKNTEHKIDKSLKNFKKTNCFELGNISENCVLT